MKKLFIKAKVRIIDNNFILTTERTSKINDFVIYENELYVVQDVNKNNITLKHEGGGIFVVKTKSLESVIYCATLTSMLESKYKSLLENKEIVDGTFVKCMVNYNQIFNRLVVKLNESFPVLTKCSQVEKTATVSIPLYKKLIAEGVFEKIVKLKSRGEFIAFLQKL